MEVRKSSRRFKVGEISEHDSSNFPRTGRISGLEVGHGAELNVPITHRQNEKKRKHLVFYEADNAHARCRLIIIINCC